MKGKETGEGRIIFLGTAGARVMVVSQILASGGLWLDLYGTQMLLDPGPGTLVQAAKRKLRATKLEAIILSHRHLDHSADVNVMIEAMTEGGLKRRGFLFAPGDALENDPVVFRYLRPALERIEILRPGGIYQVNDITFKVPLRHQHPVETYGLLFHTQRHSFAYIADTKYFDGLCEEYRAELLILNVVRLEPGGPFDHLSVPDAGKIIGEIKPRAAILTHFGMTIWRAKPWEAAKRLQEETGIQVLAARDGMVFDLAQLEPTWSHRGS